MFDSAAFWGLFVIAFIISAAIPAERVRLRATLLTIMSLVVLGTVGHMQLAQLSIVVACAVWVILLIQLCNRVSVTVPILLALAALIPAGLWVLGKSSTGPGLSHFRVFQLLGFSYFIVKAVTLIKDYRVRGKEEKPDAFVMGAYFFHFPTFLLGPMHLFAEFDKTFRNPTYPQGAGIVDAVYRITLGLFKIKLLVPLILPLSLSHIDQSGVTSFTTLILASVVYSFVILFDFSGYCDLAIATGRIMGIETPENFRRPYLAPNIRDFWQRWHITFSRVLTGYVFIPLCRTLQSRLGNRPKTIMVLGYLVTFALCGYWHGATANFLLWGFYHAIGLAIYDLYRKATLKRRLQKKPGVLPNFILKPASVGLTFSFVSLGWIFFVLPVPSLIGIGKIQEFRSQSEVSTIVAKKLEPEDADSYLPAR